MRKSKARLKNHALPDVQQWAYVPAAQVGISSYLRLWEHEK
jgi:hypothetical protein